MLLSMVALLVVALHTLHAQVLLDYVPIITPDKLDGKITASTFALEQPRCIFDNVQDVNPTDMVRLVVARPSGVEKFPVAPFPDNFSPAEFPYQSFEKNSFYMTMNTVVENYQCLNPGDDTITVLRVGSDTSCVTDQSRPDCNGPLPGPGPYQVKFVVMDSGTVKAETQWSLPITLIQGKDPSSINTQPRRRSAGMIAIASILPILFAILLAALIAALVYKYSDICDGTKITRTEDSASITHYKSHHIYDRPPQRS